MRIGRARWWTLGGAAVASIAVVVLLLVFVFDDDPGDAADDIATALTGEDRAAYRDLTCAGLPPVDEVDLPGQGRVSAFTIGDISVYEVRQNAEDFAVAVFVADRTSSFVVGQLTEDDGWCLLDLFACPAAAQPATSGFRTDWAQLRRETVCGYVLSDSRN
ncbi:MULTISPECIES: hypothetical protein [Amycolatopsis]|uniref:hypothetical protein n=1 Tax=Amycolatopsis TaxID=1813 RepID=UPI000B8AACEA|nr:MULTISPECIES: hypothetical protein [Amycolatopsis]OXM67039.1 hypothetical protein CF166_25190 [Amycolatopsis sp. KNN50.9b]